MAADKNLQYILSTALQVGDFNTALPWLETFSSDQISELALPDQRTPLHYACQHSRVDVAQRLITNCKCSIESKDAHGRTPLHTAAQYGQVGTLKYLLHRLFDHQVSGLAVKLVPGGKLSHTLMSMFQQKLSDRHRDQSGNTPLHTACVHGQLGIVQLLTREIGCDPINTNSEGLSSLHLAAQHGHLSLVRYLVEEVGSDVTLEDELGRSPTYLAAGGGHLDILKYLIEEKRADTKFKTSQEWKTAQFTMAPGRSLVHTASREGHLDVVRYLVEQHGCDLSCSDTKGCTPLHLACQQGHIDIVSYLIIEGNHEDKRIPNANSHLEVAITNLSNLLIKNKFNNTPLHLAALNGHLEVVKFVTEDMKCDPNLKGQYERTPLHFASEGGHFDVVKYLVDTHHCDLPCQDEAGDTPLHMAASEGELKVVTYLAHMTDCSTPVRNSHNNTPLNVAVYSNHIEVVKFFIEDMNCDPNIRGQSDMTPLHASLIHRHFGIAKYLIDLPNCDVFARLSHRNLPANALCLAVETQNLDIVSYLCNTRRIDPYHQPDKEKLFEAAKGSAVFEYLKSYTDPLHYAAVYGDAETVRHYVEKENWDLLKLDRYGNNTLHNAAQHGQLEVVKYLTGLSKDPINETVEILCDPLVKNKEGQTAQDIASQNGHRHVVSYLLRTTTNQPVLIHDVISPPLSIFVVGNSKSGKSTLIKALSTESSFVGKIVKMKVKGVVPLTAGIVPSTLHSQMLGKVNIYDFAGHEEYYASHEMILCQTTQPLVLLAVDISLPEEEIQKQLLYWLTILSNHSSSDASRTTHVLVIGSHADQVKLKEKKESYQQVTSLAATFPPLKYHGLIQCDCRYSVSDNLNQLRQKLSTICKSIRLFLAQDSDESNRLCAALMDHLEHNKPKCATITVTELHKLIVESIRPRSRLVPFADIALLLEICKELSSNGHLLLLPHEENERESVLILDKHVILSKVHACLQAKEVLTNKIGVLEDQQLKSILSNLLKTIMEPDLAIKYLIFTQFCTKITAEQLILVPENFTGVIHYFFPNLVNASRPADLLPPKDDSYTHLYTWGLKCSNPRQFFTPRFLHTLFVQLIKCDKDNSNARFIIWKNGVLLVHNNGTRSIIEVTDQTTRLQLAIQCLKGCESQVVKQRSSLIFLIKSLLDKVCPNVEREEFLFVPETVFPLENAEELPLAEVAHAVIHGYSTVLFDYENGRTPKHVRITDLLYFDPFHAIEERTLQDLFRHSQSTDIVPFATLTKVQNSFKGYDELSKTFEDEVDQGMEEISYSQLHSKLTQYSIFTDGNLYTLAGIEIPPSENVFDLDDLPNISNSDPGSLYYVNVLLIDVVHLWKEFGRALGLTPATIENIKSRYLYHQHNQRCLTEGLAAWLNGEGRSHDTTGPNWGVVIDALKLVDMTDLAHQLTEKLRRMDDGLEEDAAKAFTSVDNSQLANSLKEVAEYVRDLNHKWFHFGLSLGLRYSTLKDIEASPHHHDVGDHMNDVLKNWLDSKGVRGPPSWRSLAQALDCPLVRENPLALKIQTEHCI